MTYNIFSNTAPAMPKPGKGTEICKILTSQASKEMHEPLVPMSMPALASHVTDVKIMYCDNKYYELCGQMGHLIGVSGIGKAQFTNLVEAIQRKGRVIFNNAGLISNNAGLISNNARLISNKDALLRNRGWMLGID